MVRVSDRQIASTRHIYRDPRTGERVISVTSVLNAFDPTGDKLGAGAGAAVKLTKAGIDYRREWNAKKDLGTRIHAHIGEWVLGEPVEVTEEDEPYLDCFSGFCRAKRPAWIETERAVIGDQVGGRFDLVGEIEGDFWLLDTKTGKIYEIELELQLAGYASMHGMIVYDEAGAAASLEPMPHITRWAGLYLRPGEDAILLEVAKTPEEKALAVAAFRKLLDLKLWAKGRAK